MATVSILFGGENVGTHRIVRHPFVIGRDSSCDVTIDNIGVSREHCRFVWDGKHFFIEDMDSSNGTFHHGHKIRKASLGDGDEIKIGKFTLVFNHTPGEAPPSPKAGGPGDAPAAEAPDKVRKPDDAMLTFQMDSSALQAHLSKPDAGPQRAADVANSFGSRGPPTAQMSNSGQGSFLGGAVKVMAVLALLAVLAAAAVFALKQLGFIGG